MKEYIKIQMMTNISMKLGHYPEPSKHGLIKPLYKGKPKEKEDPEAYRSVNILPGLGRIMDMCTAEQQTRFAEGIGIIPRSVHGFREGHGTITAAIEMQTHVYGELAKGNIVSVCFLDVSTGFDTVPHSYLLRKLQMIGYKEKTLQWVKSYLTGRTTKVKIETRMSNQQEQERV